MTGYDPEKHHRRSIRLKGYDYTRTGAYFVTIVAYQRECLFGNIQNNEIILNEWGEIVREEWERTAVVRPNVELGDYVIMPNHIHGILIFADDIAGATRRVAPANIASTKTILPNSLGSVIGQFKSIVTKRINRLQNVSGLPVWQRNYYDHIIRNEKEMDRIARYIQTNPLRWAEDHDNPNRAS
ncbi:MAG: transposase [Anaerolineales bacterium]